MTQVTKSVSFRAAEGRDSLTGRGGQTKLFPWKMGVLSGGGLFQSPKMCISVFKHPTHPS